MLYYRLSAYETARSYFEAAVSAPDVPDEVRGKVEQYLAAIDYAGKPTRFAGQARAGIRYQTNANRAPTDGVVVLNGSPFVLDSAALGSPDGNVYGASVLHYSADLPSQGDTLEADLVTYGSKQFHREDLDVVLGELTVGPAFDLRRFGIDNGAIGFYGIASTVFIEGHFYSTGFGAGTRLVLQPGPGVSWTTAIEYRQRDYHNSEASPTAELRDGGEIRAYTYENYVVSPTLLWTGNAYIQYDWRRPTIWHTPRQAFRPVPAFPSTRRSARATPGYSRPMPAWSTEATILRTRSSALRKRNTTSNCSSAPV